MFGVKAVSDGDFDVRSAVAPSEPHQINEKLISENEKKLKLFTLRESRRGGHELRTSVYPSPSAPIATKLRQRAFQTICKFRFFDAEKKFSEKFFRFFFRFSSFSVDFRGFRLFLTSESSSSRFFALDGQIFRSVRRLELIFGFFTVRTSTCGEIWAPQSRGRRQIWQLFECWPEPTGNAHRSGG